MTSELPTSEIRWARKVATPAEAVRFLDAVGFCLLFPVRNLPLPSLYFAAARRRTVAWDRHAVRLWRWKDELPRRRRAFYAKYFKGRATFISLRLLPHFLAVERAAVLPGDHERFYSAGEITADALAVWKTLEREGPLPTLELRHACRWESRAGNARFKRAMAALQRRLIVVHFGAVQETRAWASARFELTCRAFPAPAAAAQAISPSSARAALVRKYLEWHPGAMAAQLRRLFDWPKAELAAAMKPAHLGEQAGRPIREARTTSPRFSA